MVNAHRRGLASVVLVVLALWSGACGDNSDDGGGSGDSSASAERVLDVNAAPRDQIRDGGTLRWPLDQFSTQWNFSQLDGTTSATYDVIYALVPVPFIADEQANVKENPDYVASSKVTASPKQVVTLKLNPKAKWSDGRAITWQDYEAQWQALRGEDDAYIISSSTGYERIESVKMGADEFEVVITFKQPFGEWRSLFIPLYPKQAQDSPKNFNTAYENDIPFTAGPFKLDKIDKSAKTVRLVRDPKWWGEPAKLESIVYSAPTLEAQVNAFANGEVDRVNIGADPSSVKRARNAAGGVVRVAGGPDFRHFTINGTTPILKDLNVRQALALSINREAITRSDLAGLDWPAETMNNHFFVNTQDGYVDNAGDFGKFDPARAKTMLDTAGWKLDGQYRKKDGETLKLRFVIPSGVPASRQEGELTQAMLRDVGIQLEVQTVPTDDFFDKYVTPGNFDITPFSFLGTPYPISSGKSIYIEPTKDKAGELVIQQNFARVGSPEIDRLMASAEEQVDIGKARDLINQADKLVWDLVHSIVMFQRPQYIAVNEKLVNVGAFGFKTPVYQDMGFKK